jgi:hypothetical protein
MSPTSGPLAPASETPEFEGVDVRLLWNRVARGIPQIVGLALLGTVIGVGIFLATDPFQTISTSARVVFSFPGFDRGQYPDHSKFQPDDIRSPSVIAQALANQHLDTSSQFLTSIRGALGIEGVVPPEVAREREHLRSLGQAPLPYTPDEYAITLSLPTDFPLSKRQRELLINEIVSVYRDNFQRSYADMPRAFGNSFISLNNADFSDYELILNNEIEDLLKYLHGLEKEAPSYRSPNTGLSFGDLTEQTTLFQQIQLSEPLGLIYLNGVSRDRHATLVKMDYLIDNLTENESAAIEEKKVVDQLLARVESRQNNYTLAAKTGPRTDGPTVDAGVIESLVANDAYNLLVRQSLAAGMKVAEIDAKKVKVTQRRDRMQAFLERSAAGDQPALQAEVAKAIAELEKRYRALMATIQNTTSDYQHQKFADAIRFSSAVRTDGALRATATAAAVGLALGFATGLGLSLLDVHFRPRRDAS